jgi:SAM-dependent methyltransferase
MSFERVFSRTPVGARNWMRKVKYHLMGNMSSAGYWNLAARISAKAAICTDCTDESEFFASGKREAALARKKGLLGTDVKVIDIGCGIGRIENAIYEEVRSVVGVDVSEEMIRKARERVPASNVSFQVVDGHSLNGIASGQYDLCVSFIVFQHIPRSAVANYYLEVGRVLKPTGRFLFQIPLRTIGREVEPPSQHPFGMRYYTVEQVRELLLFAGLTLIERMNQKGDVAPNNPAGDDREYEFYLASKSSA